MSFPSATIASLLTFPGISSATLVMENGPRIHVSRQPMSSSPSGLGSGDGIRCDPEPIDGVKYQKLISKVLKANLPLIDEGKGPINKLYDHAILEPLNRIQRMQGQKPIAFTMWKGDAKALAFVSDGDAFWKKCARAKKWATWHEGLEMWHVHIPRSQAYCKQAVAAALLIVAGHDVQIWNALGKKWLLRVLEVWGAARSIMDRVNCVAPANFLCQEEDVSLEEHDVMIAPGSDLEWQEMREIERLMV